jgi:hypothetical protein
MVSEIQPRRFKRVSCGSLTETWEREMERPRQERDRRKEVKLEKQLTGEDSGARAVEAKTIWN